MVTDLEYARTVVDQLDSWVNELAMPLMPLKQKFVGTNDIYLEFQHKLPHSLMIGKLVRASSAVCAAFLLAGQGFVTESAALLRMLSDFCTEIHAIYGAFNRGGELPTAVSDFVAQYFMPKARTPEAYAARERVHYVTREALMKVDLQSNAMAKGNVEQILLLRRFLNMGGDAYVHGAYETTMELYDHQGGRFFVQGHPDQNARRIHTEFAALKLHEVVAAAEVTAALTSTPRVFEAARAARREMDSRDLWRRRDQTRPG